MQTKNFFVVLSAAAVCAAPLQATASSEADKLREAMRQKMEQLNQAGAPATPAAAPKAPAPAPASAPAAPVVATDPDTDARLREALRQQTAPTPAPAPVVRTPTPSTAPVVVATPAPAPTSIPRFSDLPDDTQPGDDAALREALRAKTAPAPLPVASVGSQPAASAPAAPVVDAVQPAPVPTRSALTANMEAPPSPWTSAQQTQLDQLLLKYRADQISAQEYHTQRAAIIAAP